MALKKGFFIFLIISAIIYHNDLAFGLWLGQEKETQKLVFWACRSTTRPEIQNSCVQLKPLWIWNYEEFWVWGWNFSFCWGSSVLQTWVNSSLTVAIYLLLQCYRFSRLFYALVLRSWIQMGQISSETMVYYDKSGVSETFADSSFGTGAGRIA